MDDRVPERRDSHASSSHGLSFEPTRSADLGKHSVFTHFPNYRNCEICKRHQNAEGHRAEDVLAKSVLRSENFGDLITADHKVLSEGF